MCTANLAQAEAAADRAAAAGARAAGAAAAIPDRRVPSAAEASRCHPFGWRSGPRAGLHRPPPSVALMCGYVEQCSGRYHDAALLIDAAGCALANYRRTHLVPEDEATGLAHGQWLNLVAFAGCKLGLLIGVDIEPPEPARALALAGAAILLVAAPMAPRPRRSSLPCCVRAPSRTAARSPTPTATLAPMRLPAALSAPPAISWQPPMPASRSPTSHCASRPAAARNLAGRRPQLYQRLSAALVATDAPRS